jgi:predicted nucleic acid-binding protein
MVVKVVDASALAALLFGEPEAETVAARLGEARLVAPGLMTFELANVCLTKMRRHPEQRAGLIAAFRLRERLVVDELTVDHDGVLELAADIGLTVYDASYLWMAQQLQTELVTLDRQLARAATGP